VPRWINQAGHGQKDVDWQILKFSYFSDTISISHSPEHQSIIDANAIAMHDFYQIESNSVNHRYAMP
jgi:hypothetical protein